MRKTHKELLWVGSDGKVAQQVKELAAQTGEFKFKSLIIPGFLKRALK